MSKRPVYVPDELKNSRGWSVLNPLHTAIDMARTRMVVVAAVFVLAFSAIGLRLMDVCIMRGGDESLSLESNLGRGYEILRADIVDRNGELLATSLRTSSLYANAKVAIDPRKSAEKLVSVLPELKVDDVEEKLRSDKAFVWIARHLTPSKQAEIIRLGVPGVYFQKDERRVYPHGSLFAHMLGFTDIDNDGIAGIERHFDKGLKVAKKALRLSVDLRAQHILKDELLAGIKKFKAEGAAGMVMNVKTGEIMAMVSLPDFDPNQVAHFKGKAEAFFNRNTLGIYEMGSTFKIFNTAMALESGSVKLYQEFDVTKPLRIGRFQITDYPRLSTHWMNVAEIFVKSSNIGSGLLALKAGQDNQMLFFEKLGFLKPARMELPEMASPLVPRKWSEATIITASYGYGISVSPLQLVTATAGLVNKGIMVPPTLLYKGEAAAVEGVRVVSEQTSDIMRKLLYMVVAKGTGRKAHVDGYDVGGKTGTANVVKRGGYKEGQNNTSFIGGFPMNDPQYMVFIMVDRPKGIKETYGYNAGGWNAAPIGGSVIRKLAPLLGVQPASCFKQRQKNPMLLNVSIRR